MTKKQKLTAVAVAIVVGTPVGLALTMAEESARAATKSPAETACVSGEGQKVPDEMKALCVVVGTQPAYEMPKVSMPVGTKLVTSCRKKAAEQSVLAGDARVGEKFVVSCLIAQHEQWWNWQAELTSEKPKKNV